MLRSKWFRPITSSNELALQAQVEQLLAGNPMLTDPRPIQFQLAPLCRPRWLVEYRDQALYVYRASDQLRTRQPIGAIFPATS
jgi:hypothetical protein